jgi:hypothetical protein
MPTLVVVGCLKVLLGLTKIVERGGHFWLINPTFPVAAPVAPAPIAPPPTAELTTINGAPFAILEHALFPARTTSVDSKGFDTPMVGINPEGAVSHAKRSIGTSQFTQTIGHIHVVLGGTVLCAQDDVLPLIALRRQHGW